MTIRLASIDDAQAIHNLHTASVTRLCTMYAAETIAGWLAGRTPEGYKGIAKNEMYVYEAQGKIIGFSHVVNRDIAALFVSPESAGKGVGSALMRHALHHIRQRCEGPISLESTLNAVPFYEKMGFKKTGDSLTYRNNVEIPTVLMEQK